MRFSLPSHNRRGLSVAAVAVVSLSAACIYSPTAADSTPTPKKTTQVGSPNFLYINLDDARYEDFKYMPFTRKLITNQGVEATNMVAPTPICVPSRASALTGKMAHNHGMITVEGPKGTADGFHKSGENKSTVAVWLNNAGYDTFTTGKWLNGYEKELPEGFTEPGWDRWNPATIGTYAFFHTKFFTGNKAQGDGRYNTYQITDRSVNWIKARENDNDPWFAWVNYVGPHNGLPYEEDDPEGVPTTARAPQDVGRFANLKLPATPDMWRGAPGSLADKTPNGKTKAAARKIHQQRVEAVQSIDRGIQQQVAALQKTGQLKNTYIIVTSDNGYTVGEHNHVGKLLPYKGIRTVPFSMRGPGIKPDTKAHSAMMIPDLPVTIAALAGVEPNSNKVDGMNVFPVLTGEIRGVRSVPIAGWLLGAKDVNKPLYTGLMHGKWLLVRNYKNTELYNHQQDPYELKNLAGNPKYANVKKKLKAIEEQLRHCAGTQCDKTYNLPQ